VRRKEASAGVFGIPYNEAEAELVPMYGDKSRERVMQKGLANM